MQYVKRRDKMNQRFVTNSNGHWATNAASKSASNTWGAVPGSSKPLSPGYSASPLSWRFFADTTSTSTAFALMTRGHGFTRQRINSSCRYFCLFKQFQPTSPYLVFVLDLSTILPAFRPFIATPESPRALVLYAVFLQNVLWSLSNYLISLQLINNYTLSKFGNDLHFLVWGTGTMPSPQV